MGLFNFEKLRRLGSIIKWNGGLRQSMIKLWYYDDLKIGNLVGMDQFGNKYYENNNYFFGRNRWVEYNLAWGLDYDASMVPPEWYGWLHYRTDYTPCEDPTRPVYSWQKPHIMNLSGTPYQYVPFDTTRNKIEAWTPPTPAQVHRCETQVVPCMDTTSKYIHPSQRRLFGNTKVTPLK